MERNPKSKMNKEERRSEVDDFIMCLYQNENPGNLGNLGKFDREIEERENWNGEKP